MDAAGSRDRCRWPGVDLCLETVHGDLLEPGGHQAHPVDPPGKVHRQPRAVYKYWAGLRRLRLSRTSLCSGSSSSSSPSSSTWRCLRLSSSTDWWIFWLSTETGTQCKLCRSPLRSHRCSSWIGWDTPVVVQRQLIGV